MRACLVSLLLALLLSGCAANPKKQASHVPVTSVPIFAVIYDVPSGVRSEGGVLSIEGIRNDWARLKELGFNAVVLLKAEATDQAALKGLAKEKQLLLSTKDRELELYVRAGALPIGCENASRLASRIADRSKGEGNQTLLVCAPPRTPPAKERAKAIQDDLSEFGIEVIWGGVESGVVDSVNLSVVRAEAAETESAAASYLERWLGDYHRGLATGKTSGVVFDGAQFIPGLSTATGSMSEGDTRARLAGLTELHNRQVAWGNLIHGSEITPIASPPGGTSHVRLASLRSKGRRFLLAVNDSDANFIRQEITLNGTMDGIQTQRLVEVPGTLSIPAGRIIDAHDGLIRLDIDLRPGDAQLFEVFGK